MSQARRRPRTYGVTRRRVDAMTARFYDDAKRGKMSRRATS